MEITEVKRFESLYQRHLKMLKLQGKSKSTIDAYSRSVRRCQRKELRQALAAQVSILSIRGIPSNLQNYLALQTVKISLNPLYSGHSFEHNASSRDQSQQHFVSIPSIRGIPSNGSLGNVR